MNFPIESLVNVVSSSHNPSSHQVAYNIYLMNFVQDVRWLHHWNPFYFLKKLLFNVDSKKRTSQFSYRRPKTKWFSSRFVTRSLWYRMVNMLIIVSVFWFCSLCKTSITIAFVQRKIAFFFIRIDWSCTLHTRFRYTDFLANNFANITRLCVFRLFGSFSFVFVACCY